MKVRAQLNVIVDNITDAVNSSPNQLHMVSKIGGITVATMHDDVQRNYLSPH